MIDNGQKFLVFSLSTLIGFFHHTPPVIEAMAFWAMLAVIVDTILGVVKGALTGSLTSRAFRLMAYAKAREYGGGVFILAVASSMFGTFFFLGVGVAWVLTSEILSILENVVDAHRVTGKDWGAINPVISLISGAFNLPTRTLMSTHTLIELAHPNRAPTPAPIGALGEQLGIKFEAKSWLSQILGLDKHPAELAVVNAAGNAVITGIEATVPLAKTLIDAAEAIGAAPTNPITVVSSVGTVLSAFDPSLITQIEQRSDAFVLAFAAKFNIPAADAATAITELNALELSELQALGLKASAAA